MDDLASGKIATFVFIGLVVPLLYVAVNILFRYVLSLVSRSDDDNENRYPEHLYIGFDLSMAAFVAVGLWLLEPPPRLLPPLPFMKSWMITYKDNYGIGTASAIDFIMLMMTFAMQCSFEAVDKPKKNPNKWQAFWANFRQAVGANFLGLLAFVLTVYLVRG